MTFPRCQLLTLIGAAIAVAGVSPIAQAESDPHHPVRMLVPCPAGSPTDISARVIAQRWSENSKRKFYVENLPIGPATVGLGTATEALADKYTVLFDLVDCNNDASIPQ